MYADEEHQAIDMKIPRLARAESGEYAELLKYLLTLWRSLTKGQRSRADMIIGEGFGLTYLLEAFPRDIDFLSELCRTVSSLKISNLRLEFEIGLDDIADNRSRITIKKITLYVNRDVFMSLDLSSGSLSSKMIKVPRDSRTSARQVREYLSTDKRFFDAIDRRSVKTGSMFFDVVLGLIQGSIDSVAASLRTSPLYHLNPTRAAPKRVYDCTNLHLSQGMEGMLMPEVLRDDENRVLAKVNGWLQTFGISLRVDTYEELFHRLVVLDRRKEGLELDLPDIGFGYSQILPVLTQLFLAEAGSITVVEQPEVHLHPTMQAELADLFIDAVIDRNRDDQGQFTEGYGSVKTVLVETHSEYFMHRLRRRIAQKGDGSISADDVAIYFIGADEESQDPTINRIEVREGEAFDWPKGFSYVLEDTTEYLIEQIRQKGAKKK